MIRRVKKSWTQVKPDELLQKTHNLSNKMIKIHKSSTWHPVLKLHISVKLSLNYLKLINSDQLIQTGRHHHFPQDDDRRDSVTVTLVDTNQLTSLQVTMEEKQAQA